MLHHDVLTLLNLPSDIIRHIIVIDMDWIDVMRQISPRWNMLAIEHMSVRSNLPTIELFSFVNSSDNGSLHIRMRVSRKYRVYFGTTNWLAIKNSRTNIVDLSSRIDFAKLPRIITRIFDRCWRIKMLTISMELIESHGLGNIVGAMGEAPIEEIALKKMSSNSDSVDIMISPKIKSAMLKLAQFPCIRMVINDSAENLFNYCRKSDPRDISAFLSKLFRNGSKVVFTKNTATTTPSPSFIRKWKKIQVALADMNIDLSFEVEKSDVGRHKMCLILTRKNEPLRGSVRNKV